jgi:hypothetical protein
MASGNMETTTKADDADDEVLEFMDAPAIKALGLSQDRLKTAYEDGELAHLTEDEAKALFEDAYHCSSREASPRRVGALVRSALHDSVAAWDEARSRDRRAP